jgi:hypothetical protein
LRQNSLYPEIGTAIERNFQNLEQASGSFSSLLLPSPLTGIPFLSQVRNNFENQSLLATQLSSPWSSIFISVAILFSLMIIFVLLFSRSNSYINKKLAENNLSNSYIRIFLLLFILGLFFYWTTGLGTLFGFLISDYIQNWTQIFIFLAYFAVAIFLIAIKQLEVLKNRVKKFNLGILFLTLLVIFVDQVANPYPVNARDQENYKEVTDFSRTLSNNLEKNCPILQLPINPYPEGNYDHFWLALADSSRSYSFGANKATQQFIWQNNLESENLQKLSLQAAAVGYCAIVVDLSSFESRVEEGNRWIKALGAPMAVSESARWAAWDVETNYTKNQLRELISLNWFGTFAAGEVQNEIQIDFYEEEFNLYALNPTQEKIVGEVSFDALSGTCTPSQSVKVTDSSSGTVLLNSEVNKEPKLLSFKIELEPREQKRIDFELSSRICTVEWWSDTKVAFREQEFKLS